MPDEVLLADLSDGLLVEQSAYEIAYRQEGLDALQKGEALVTLQKAQGNLLHGLEKIGSTGDLETILLAEKLILENEKGFYADTPVMEASLNYALTEIIAALTLIDKIQDPVAYKSVTDDYYQSVKNRISGLPRDEARQFFKSHHSRLTNHEKSRLSGIDKELIGARKANLNKVRMKYIELQKNALVTPETEPEIENNYTGRPQ